MTKNIIALPILALLASMAGAAEIPMVGAPVTTPQESKADASLKDRRLPTLEEAARAQKAIEELIRAYEAGNVGLVQSRLDPGMIGFQRLIDGMRQDANMLKQMRIHLYDVQVTAGPDVAMVTANWEKRFFAVNDYQPGLFSGRTTFLMHFNRNQWKLAAISGDNLFSSQSGTLAQLTLTNLAGSAAPAATSIFRVELVDPDVVGAGTVHVELLTGQGDREQLTLAPTGLGRYAGTMTSARTEVVIPGNGVINLLPGSATTTVTVRYLDQNPGGGRPPSWLTRTISVP